MHTREQSHIEQYLISSRYQKNIFNLFYNTMVFCVREIMPGNIKSGIIFVPVNRAVVKALKIKKI